MTIKRAKAFFLRTNSEAHQEVLEAVRELRETLEQFKTAPRAGTPAAEEQIELLASGLVRSLLDDWNTWQRLEHAFYDDCERMHFGVDKAMRKELRRERRVLGGVIGALHQRQGTAEYEELVAALHSDVARMLAALKRYTATLARLKAAVSAYIDSPGCSEAIRAHDLIAKYRIGQADEGDVGAAPAEEDRAKDRAFVVRKPDKPAKRAAALPAAAAEATKAETLAQLDFVSACNTFTVHEACAAHGIDAAAVRAAQTPREAGALLKRTLTALRCADLERMHAAPAYELFGEHARAACALDFVDTCNALGADIACSLFGLERGALRALASDTDALCAKLGRITPYHLRALGAECARDLFGAECAAALGCGAANGTGRALRRRRPDQRAFIAAMAEHLDAEPDSDDDADDGLPRGAREERDRRGYDGEEGSESVDGSFEGTGDSESESVHDSESDESDEDEEEEEEEEEEEADEGEDDDDDQQAKRRRTSPDPMEELFE